MDRRTFVLLTGATSGALIRPPVRPTHSPTGAGWRSGGPAVGRLRFELDDHRRWSLWYYGDGSPVPVVRGAEIVAWVGDQPLTLAELEDSTVGSRRPPGGDAVVVRGRAAGVWVEAELLTAGGASTPQASVTVTLFPDRYLPTVRGVRFLQLPHAEVLVGDGPLVALVNGADSADPSRAVTVAAPAGWCTRAEWSGTVAEADVIANLDFSAANFDRRFFRHIELDDGYQRAIGAWDANERFPHGHAWLTDQIHARGFKAGLWVAPFGVAEGSGVPGTQPDWLLRDASGPVVCETREAWGGKIYALDGAHPKAQQWLFDLARRVVREWGYDYLRIDRLRWATVGTTHYGGLTHAEAYRAGLGAIRDGLGTEAFLLASGAPLQHAVGLVNCMRIGPDVDASWSGIQPPVRAAGLRSFYHRSTWLNDPDCLVVRPPLSQAAAEVWASIVAVTGGLTLFADNLPKVPPDRLPLLQRALPVAPVAGGAIEAEVAEHDTAPAIVAGDAVYSISGPWRFRTGDDPSYGARGFDEEAWETIHVPQRWDDAGHRDYVGFAWYRTRFQLPKQGDAKMDRRNLFLELGKIADADETFVNGVSVGQTGDLSQGVRGDPQAYRRYRVPSETLNWGGENMVAVRVLGSGGIWSVRRSRPPRVWVAEGAPRWWTVVIVNWETEPLDMSLPLATLGITGAMFDAYDVWQDAPVANLKGGLAVALEPRTARTIAIRPTAARPQVIGTARHVVQGAVDVADERWDPTP